MPRPKPKVPVKMVSFRFPLSDIEKLEELAHLEGVGKSHLVRLLIRRSYERRVKA